MSLPGLPATFAAGALYDHLIQAALRQFFDRAVFETKAVPSLSSDGRLAIEPTGDPATLCIRWFGSRHTLAVPPSRPFTPHESRFARAIGAVLAARYRAIFNPKVLAERGDLFRGAIEDRYTAATLHCLIGCAIGEFIGLAIGVHFGLGPWVTMALATALGFASGFAVSLIPLVRSGLSLASAWRAIWLGETISIAAMEAAMNLADYHVGVMSVGSLADPRFWAGYGAALIAGFAVGWPVNRWMLGRELKRTPP